MSEKLENSTITREQLISVESLFTAWEEFCKGKRKRLDVQIFEKHLEDNLFLLNQKLQNKTYKHGGYEEFYVQDPKVRHIHKASVEDRVVHHLLYKFLYKEFDPGFIYDSYSCRLNKGTHEGVDRLKVFARKVACNYTEPCWGLKCDVKKFFASVDQQTLIELLSQKISDQNILWLLKQVIISFHSQQGEAKGVPLGNLTSQVFANIYLNELDQFIKHELKIKYYLRYADDFLILDSKKEFLESLIDPIGDFLQSKLKLELHPRKVTIRKLNWGIDFLGYIVLPHYSLPRVKTRKRVFQKLKEKVNFTSFDQSLQSYLGYLRHANSHKLQQRLISQIWFWSIQI